MFISPRLAGLATAAVTTLAITVLGAPSATAATPLVGSSAGGTSHVQTVANVQPMNSRDYQRGYQQGYRQAFRDGYGDGRAACRNRSRAHSRIQSQADFERGYADGYERGYNSGFALGCHNRH